ncbi:MAG: dephospho-CoA kinase [Chitinophagales bacterium]|jgi:dephospho-CoA kinase|nr:dephospho-CoA kinase [Sphingobacteriales bacterium]
MKIGVTGGIGSGKSLVVNELERLGAVVYRADKKAKELVYLPEVKEQILKKFGSMAFENDLYNTKYIASIVFEDSTKLHALNAIVHPAVFKDLDKFCIENKGKTIVYESALMMETGHTHLFDKVILVTAPLELRIERVMARDKVDKAAVVKRIEKQWTDEKKRELADIIVVNINKEETLMKVRELWENNFNLKA